MFDPFPAPGGAPHYYLYSEGQGHLCTCNPRHAVQWVQDWLAVGAAQAPDAPTLALRLSAPPPLPAPAPAKPITWQPHAALPPDLPDEWRPAVLADIASADLPRIALGFARNPKGQAAKGSAVALAGYGPPPRFDRRQWMLHAHAIAAGVLQLQVLPLIPGNQSHNWQSEPWRWRGNLPWPDDATRWGIAADPARARQALADLAAGRFDDALARYGIGHTPALAQVLHARPQHVDSAHLAPLWAADLAQVLTRLAPWRLAQAPLPATRKPRLHLLPRQTQQQKAALVIAQPPQGRQLDIQHTGSNERLPASHFLREADHPLPSA